MLRVLVALFLASVYTSIFSAGLGVHFPDVGLYSYSEGFVYLAIFCLHYAMPPLG